MRLTDIFCSDICISSINILYQKYSYFYQAADGSEAVLTLLNGHIDGTLNYYEPNKLLTIESCGTGEQIIYDTKIDYIH